MKGLKYAQANKNHITLPLIVIENGSIFELRDSLLKSSRNDTDSSQDNNKCDWTMKDKSASVASINESVDDSMILNEIEEVCIWVNGSSMNESCNKGFNQEINSMILITSCIFHNFFNVYKGGVNATATFQKCVIKDTRSHSMHAVNPKALFIDRCSIINVKKCGIFIEWLKHSNHTEVGRNIVISGSEIRNTANEGIFIQAS